MAKIGFRHYDNDNKGNTDSKDNIDKIKALPLSTYIKAHYSPTGDTPNKVFKTSAELIYDLSNITDTSTSYLAAVLTNLGFQIEYIAGQPYWVMYEL